MKNRFSGFNPDERAIIFTGLCKINIPTTDPLYMQLQQLLDEFTK